MNEQPKDLSHYLQGPFVFKVKNLPKKDLRRELAEAKAANKHLLNCIEKNFTFETTQGNKYNIFNTVRKVFAEELKETVAKYLYRTNFDGHKDFAIDFAELCKIIDELLKE